MKRITIFVIRVYQVIFADFIQGILMSVFGFRMKCKYTPSCSEYMVLQVKKHGTIIGIRKGVTRILSCH